jgi:hypothetical protein
MSDEKKTHKVKPERVEAEHLMAFTYYVKVKNSRNNGENLIVTDLDNAKGEIQINGKDLVQSSMSADLFEEVEKVSMTKAASILVESHNRPMTVAFVKADGTDRVMRCRLVRPEPLLGRSMVEDLDSTDAHRVRQVDHRTIKYLIVDGMRYEVK